MQIPEKGVLLRIFIGESDQHSGIPLHEAIVKKARELGLAGATVCRGIMGYGASSRIHTSKILRLSEDLPVIIELVDSEERINLMLPWLDEHCDEGLMTMEAVRVLHYRSKRKDN